MLESLHKGSSVKKVIAVMSGKGGVGKSMVTALLAVLAQRAGYKTAILDAENTPVVWRGPVIAGTVKQFWTDVLWGDLDVMFIDMPPGTGDVPLTVFQSVPVDGAVVVTTPQALVGMIVEKALNMADMMHIPVLGLVENMSYAVCPDCGKHVEVFGESHAQETAQRFNTQVLARLPINLKLAAACDAGLIELFEGDWLEDAIRKILA